MVMVVHWDSLSQVSGLDGALRPLFPRYAALVPRSVDDHPWRRAGVLFVGALVVAEILHRAVERPFMGLGRRIVEGSEPITVSRRTRWAIGAAAALSSSSRSATRSRWPSARTTSRGAAVTASSRENDAHAPGALTDGVLEDDTGLLTRDEDDPWAIIDLGKPTDFGAVRVYNRNDAWTFESRGLEVSTSVDGARYSPIGRCATPFSQAWPCRFSGELRARYVKLRIDRRASLGLVPSGRSPAGLLLRRGRS
jgi:hypothetical protein